MSITLHSFRIQNFKSVIDSREVILSVDGVTVFIGQNEAGKSAILEALFAFEKNRLSEAHLRSEGVHPSISVTYRVDSDDRDDLTESTRANELLAKYLSKHDGLIGVTRSWSNEDGELKSSLVFQDSKVSEAIERLKSELVELSENSDEEVRQALEQEIVQLPTVDDVAQAIYDAGPDIVLFDEKIGLLPNAIDVADVHSKSDHPGYLATKNFLAVAGVEDIDELAQLPLRIRDSKLASASKRISREFQNYWRQTIGKTSKIKLACEVRNHDAGHEQKQGAPYLIFWILDEEEQKLHPSQRSRGVQWFLSFYLQMQARARANGIRGCVYLLDEPGGSLHANAQEDVLKLIEIIKENVQIIYTTHSPHMIKMDHIHRIKAVQRYVEDDDSSPTRVISAPELASASTDTLSPIFSAMGISFAHQNVIRQSGNVILEELSAYYYFRAFSILLGIGDSKSYLPAIGVGNVPALANLLLGWGLSFGVVLDDEQNGRRVFNDLKRNLFGDDEELAVRRLLKLKGCKGVEDLFSVADFDRYVVAHVAHKRRADEKNAAFVSRLRLAKAVVAYRFFITARGLTKGALEDETVNNFQHVLGWIDDMER